MAEFKQTRNESKARGALASQDDDRFTPCIITKAAPRRQLNSDALFIIARQTPGDARAFETPRPVLSFPALK
jgi:hypothetical protein